MPTLNSTRMWANAQRDGGLLRPLSRI